VSKPRTKPLGKPRKRKLKEKASFGTSPEGKVIVRGRRLTKEHEFQLRMALIEKGLGAATVLFRYAGLAAVGFFVWLSIRELAGRNTNASVKVGLDFLASIELDKWIPYVFASVAILYGLNERRVRREAIARMATTIKSLEEQIDPKRSSSNLTKRGTTNRKDKSAS
jgi:hypothetical protein